ncbi:MAG: LysR family transcriptional regulator [Burkholderiales bacterium PBB6]|nr:MAG: LysR family transcriptional regulator [Burkholderiales bacterium PBB6]
MQLSHRHIEVFRAVMRSGQVTQAAQWLHTSQPTISRELARLEQVLGMQLFERVRGRLVPTPRALALLEEVELSYVGLERIAATALSLRQSPQGRLQVLSLPALTQALLPQALRLLLAASPGASVAITPQESPALEAALSEQRFDLGLTERREAPVGCELQRLLVADEVAVLPAGHALLARTRLSPADFEGQTFISLAATDPYRQQIDAVFAQAGVQRQLALETPSAVSVCALVQQGLGVAIVNPLTAIALQGAGLHLRPLTVSIPFHVAAVLPTTRSPHPLRPALLEALQAAADAMLAPMAHSAGRQT